MTTAYNASDVIRNLQNALKSKNNIKTFSSIVLLFFYQLMMAVTVMTIAPDNARAYRSIFLVSFVLAIMPVIIARAIRSDIIPAVMVGFLIESGLAFQATISDDYSASPGIIYLALISIPATIFFQRKIWEKVKNHRKILTAVYAASTAFLGIAGLAMRLFLSPQNEAYCWVYIGGTSIQLTEVLKLLYLLTIFIGARISKSDKDLFIKTLFPTVVFSAALIIVNEGGTLLLCAATWLVVLFFLTENAKQLMIEFGAILMSGSVGLLCLAVFRKILVNKNGIAGTVYAFSDKVFNRIFTLVSSENTDTYQIDRALKAFRQGRLLGTDSAYLTSIPEHTNDMILASVTARFGSIIAVFIILAFAIFIIVSIRRYQKDDNGTMLIISSSNLFLQALIVIFGNLRIGPVVGLTLPLISSGWSSFIVSCSLFTLALISMGESNAITKREE